MKTKKNKAQKISKLEKGINELITEKEIKVKKSKEVLEPKDEIKEEKKVKKTKKEKLIGKAKKNAEANLLEEVVTKREVKYIYPEDMDDTLSRKKFRQQIRNKIHQLELAMHRIEDKTSKEFKKAEKEYTAYRKENVKDKAAV